MSNSDVRPPRRIAIIGGGPAGLFAAERLRAAGLDVDLYEAKGSPGRKFLIAGKGGLNLTHSDPRPLFDSRYREQATRVGRWLDGFDAQALRDWAAGFGVETYVGSSGRVFPVDRKAAPLLRGWIRRLKEQGVRLHVNHRWLGWSDDGALRFATDNGELEVRADATVLALGGGSWPQLGSDGAWVPTLQARTVDIAPLQSANCGFDIAWTPFFAQRHAGAPLRPVVAHWHGLDGEPHTLQGECVASEYGIEGSLIYALSADLRETLNRDGHATLWLDLVPGRDEARLLANLSQPRKGRSFGEHLRRQAGLDPVKTALVFETLGKDAGNDLAAVIATLKRLPLRLLHPRPMAEVISTAGGVRLDALDEGLMLRALPGVFCAGEMLDWEAPTGGYLLTACYASGLRAAEGVTAWLATR
ncbi:aminoacetone oxidase family FAD-binding enzyme [Stenotrophomonas indicatrix]|uniref:TIGR03862 family flavoprotein n=1 Tax=Stenotrophomonas indicatrix TaxID=2045451 RepID=UPI000C1A4E2A|nr:TIGR03862 family flavoprotein [Stenotrophomonas indicatrix]PII15335.1 aminoacetone oxidase family FAD-binding enzyme [Stenotrophomonas indicatrix]